MESEDDKASAEPSVSWRRATVDLEASLHSSDSTADCAASSASSIGAYYDKLASGGKRSVASSASRKGSVIMSEPVTFAWHEVDVYANVKEKSGVARKQILYGVSGIVETGQMVAILGGSGAGKTTLLNALTQRNMRSLQVEGTMTLNGQKSSARALSNVSAYVQQDDLFIGALTVREQLVFQALLRLPRRLTRQRKIRRADEVLVELGLSKCAHTKIGIPGILTGISGGERKRLSFASSVLNNPSLLFCDEPTTGLDSYMAENAVGAMQTLAAHGKTILCTIHQPASEIYALFDRVLYLADGRVAFFGDAADALQFFNNAGYSCPVNYNPADFIIDLLSVRRGNEQLDRLRVDDVCERYTSSAYAKRLAVSIDESASVERDSTSTQSLESASTYECDRWLQLALMTWRSLLYNFRNPVVSYARMAQKLVMGLFVALLYLQTPLDQKGVQNVNGALYYTCQQMIYPCIFGVLTFLPLEYPILCREHHDRMYTVWAWYLGKVFSIVPVYSTDGIIYMVAAYYLVGLRSAFTAFLLALLITVMLEQTSAAFGTMLSAVSPSFPVAIVISGPILTIISMAGGLSANVGALPPWIAWIKYFSFYLYGFEAYTINQWSPISNITCEAGSYSCLRTGDEVLASLSFLGDTVWAQFLLMIAFTLAVHIIGYVGLLIRVSRER